MPGNIEKWRSSIGLFQPILGLQAVNGFRDLRVVNYKVIVFLVLLLLSYGDIELKPGPTRKLAKLSCCHWNVNCRIQQRDNIYKSYLKRSKNNQY